MTESLGAPRWWRQPLEDPAVYETGEAVIAFSRKTGRVLVYRDNK